MLILISRNLLAARRDSHQDVFLPLVIFMLYYSLDAHAKETLLLRNVGSLILKRTLRHSSHRTGNGHKCGGCRNGNTIKGQNA